MIQSYNERTGKVVHSRINDVVNTGKKLGYRVKTSSGKSVVVSSIHPFLTEDGWKKIIDLKVGDKVALPKKYVPITDVVIPDDDAYFIGLSIAEGGLTQRQYKVSTAEPEVVEFLESYAKSKGMKFRKISEYTYGISRRDTGVKHHPIMELLDRYELMGKKSLDKALHPEMFRWCSDAKLNLIRGLFDGDSTVCKSSGSLMYTSGSKELIDGIYQILLEFGVFSSLGSVHVKGSEYYTLSIYPKYLEVPLS